MKPTRRNRRHHGCTRLIRLRGTLTLSSKQGTNTFIFNGRIGGRTLRPGAYRVTAVPTANGRTGNARRTGFKILP